MRGRSVSGKKREEVIFTPDASLDDQRKIGWERTIVGVTCRCGVGIGSNEVATTRSNIKKGGRKGER